MVCGVVGALVIGVFGALLIRVTHAPPDAIAIIALLVLLALSLRPTSWYLSNRGIILRWSAERPEPSPSPSPTFDACHLLDLTTTVGSPSNTRRPAPLWSAGAPGTTRRSRSQVVLGCLGLTLFALGASLATVTSLKEWTPPPELSMVSGAAGRPVAEVRLGSAGPIAAALEVTTSGKTVWLSRLARTTAAQSVDLPASLRLDRSQVLLVSDGHTLREVDG